MDKSCCKPTGKNPNVTKYSKLCQCVTIDGPIEISNFPDQIDVVKSHYCDADTGTHFECIKIYINGVLDSEELTDTGIPCEDPLPDTPDVEKIQYCNPDTNTLWVKVCKYTTTPEGDTTEEILSETDLGIDCSTTQFQIVRECRDDFINLVTYAIDSDGIKTEVEATTTDEECNEIDYEYVIRKSCIDGTEHEQLVQIDNASNTEVNIGAPIDTLIPCGKQKVEIDTCDGTDSALVDQVVKVEGNITAKLCPEDKIEIDVEYFCDSDSDFIQESVTTTTNGTPVTVVTPTTIRCEDLDLSRDFEESILCDTQTKTKHIVTTAYAQDSSLTIIGDIDTEEPCCQGTPECVESQEWTYGIDNTGTSFAEDNTIRVTLSDGSSFEFFQPATTNWTPQMQIWGDEIQAAADANGIAWFVETRFRSPSNPSDLSGGGGFAGPPSVAVSNNLTNMAWRYVNIQICPGQPVPVSAEIIDSSNPARIGFNLTSDGAVLGPIQKFIVCRCCGEEPVWYLEDGVTLAEAGQIPNCFEPCGTLALTDNPPDRECKFEIDVACDNNNSSNTVDFTNTITRRATVCNGEQIAVDYFEADPNDPNALIPYTLVGDFVDCATGEPVDVPSPPCSDFEIVKLYKVELNGDEGFRNREWHDTAPTSNIFDTESGRNFRENHDFSLPTTVDSIQNNFTLNDTDNTVGELDIQAKDGYIIVSQDMLLRYGGASEGYWAVELGECCEELELLNESGGFSPTRTMEFTIPKGIHQLRLWNIDSGGSNSSANLSYSLDGGITWIVDNTPPNIDVYTGKPNEICENIKVCKDTGDFIGLLDGNLKDSTEYYDCPQACSKSNCLTC